MSRNEQKTRSVTSPSFGTERLRRSAPESCARHRPALLTPQLGEGLAQCAYEVADTKVIQVMDFARQHRHPLQCSLEKA